ncbi:MAG TPA: XRE family transcriptional regulator [Rhodopila sp.]|nr:XRE family transcriptional regulator [Rhodopila sp.]
MLGVLRLGFGEHGAAWGMGQLVGPVLMTALKDHITSSGMTQAEAAELFGVTQPRVSDLMPGKINLFGLDAPVGMATAAGLRIEMRV